MFRTLACLFSVITLSLTADTLVTRDRIEEALPDLERFVEVGMARSHVPGVAIAIVHNERILYLKGFGYRNLEEELPVTPDTVFQVASVSKPITSTIIAALVGKGKVSWDDRISDLNPSFQLADPWVTAHLTVKDLLSHRSGLPDHAGDILEDYGYPVETILHQLRFITDLGSFREDYAYTNFGFSEGAYAVAKSQGSAWSDLAEETLFKPLGMTATSSRFDAFENSPERSITYQIQNEEPVALDPPRQPDAQAPAGGVSSSARDMANWLILQLGGFSNRQIVTPDALLETHTPAITTGVNHETGNPSFYALGWDVSFDNAGRRFLKHSGGFNLGVRSQVALLPSENIGIVVLTNASPTGLPEAVTKAFFDLLFGEAIEKGLVDKANEMWLKYQFDPIKSYSVEKDVFTPALPMTAYVGTYENDYFGTVRVTPNNGGLQLVVGPAQKSLPLKHLTRDSFTFETIGENAAGESLVTFIPNMTEESEFQQSRRLDFEPGKAGGEAAPARSRGDAAGFKGQDAGEDENRFFSHIRYTIDDTSKAKSILIEAFNRFGKGEFQKVQ